MADVFINRHATAGIDIRTVTQKELAGTAPGAEGVARWCSVTFAVEHQGPVELLLHAGALNDLILRLTDARQKLTKPPEFNPECDHYWLVRRGGGCPHCKKTFQGSFRDL